MFNLLDYPEWRTDAECWRRLLLALHGHGAATAVNDADTSGVETSSLSGADGDSRSELSFGSSEGGKASGKKLEALFRARNLAKREWLDSRADWWPKMHFGPRAADRDLESPEFKKLIGFKNSFAKFIKGLSKAKLVTAKREFSLAEKYFKSYGERVNERIRNSHSS